MFGHHYLSFGGQAVQICGTFFFFFLFSVSLFRPFANHHAIVPRFWAFFIFFSIMPRGVVGQGFRYPSPGDFPPRWHDGMMARWHDGTMARWHDGTMARWHDGTMARWHDGTMARWHDGTMARWHDGTMARWHDGTMARWHDGTMARWHDGTMARWHDGTMARWHDGTMARWHDDTLQFFCSLRSLYAIFFLPTVPFYNV